MKKVYCIRDLCLSCHQCEMSCAIEHSEGKTLGDALAEPVVPVSRVAVKVHRKTGGPVVEQCRHCNPAPCSTYCTAGALRRDFSTGLVIIEESLCTGCRVCRLGCQFGVISFTFREAAGVKRIAAVKCDGCIDRVKAGEVPACVESCPTGALVYTSNDENLKALKKEALEVKLRF